MKEKKTQKPLNTVYIVYYSLPTQMKSFIFSSKGFILYIREDKENNIYNFEEKSSFQENIASF